MTKPERQRDTHPRANAAGDTDKEFPRDTSEVSRCAQEAVPAERYTPTVAESKALAEHAARTAKRKPCPRLRLAVEGPKGNLVVDHADLDTGLSLMMAALGSTDQDFVTGLMHQLANASARDGKPDELVFSFMLSVVKALAPQDEVESMLAAQMAAVHIMSMNLTSRLAHAETRQQQDSAERALNKLTRTFASQIEALKRYRTGGQQKVTVEHVHVHDGGQAIVVEHKGGGCGEKN